MRRGLHFQRKIDGSSQREEAIRKIPRRPPTIQHLLLSLPLLYKYVRQTKHLPKACPEQEGYS